ncbi:expressed unknown protein [Seminavis robusta]|uniref:Uncharacterized protein n=1 Tax=Seminavis robusta TaxID=568900 RepID=A0A9N8F2Q1_9STRA|nr:expressed unknown protein [Seminavis robusta]|eukprot:Sro2870_g339100.1 n/a (384) ;mRNA; r:8604-9755
MFNSNHLLASLHLLAVRVAILLLMATAVAAKGGGRGGSSSSGSRGSGSGSSGSSYNSGGHYYGSSGGGNRACDKTCGIVLAVVFSSIAAITVCLCFVPCFLKRKQWERSCDDAERSVLEDATKTQYGSSKPVVHYSTCSFSASYNDSTYENGSKTLHSTGTLNFATWASSPTIQVKSINGNGRDTDGTYTIARGAVSIWSGKACWIEQTSGSSTQSLVTGKFFTTPGNPRPMFAGSFKCNNGAKGSFSQFNLDINNNAPSMGSAQPPRAHMDVNLVSTAAASVIPTHQPPDVEGGVEAVYGGMPVAMAQPIGYSTTTNTATTISTNFHIPSIFAPATSSYQPAYNPPAAAPSYQPSTAAYQPSYTPSAPSPSDNIPSIFRPPA